MDPDRVGHYLQAACAGLGFDIGEVWITSSNSGASTVASIEDKSQNGSAAKKYNRFLQLYTSKSYDDQRCNLLTPQSQKKSPFLRRNGSNGDFDDESSIEKHVLSPRLVEAISTSMQVVWANCQKREGLLGRSDMCLQTAVGMPVAVDSNGNICSVIMFSRYDIKSNEDALEYLQFISRSATTSIPCLLPVIENKSESEQINNRLMQIPTSTGKPSSMPVNLPDGVTARFVSFNDKENNYNAVSDKNLSIEARPGRDVKAAPKDCFGIPMLPSFAEIGYDEEDVTPDPSPISIISDDAFDEASYGVWSTIMENQTKNNNNKKKEAEVATFSSKADQTQTKPLETSRTQEKADGFENKSNLTPSSKQSSSSTLSVKLEPILSPRKIEQLEEFITAFLGMSVFDIADVWMPENNDGFGSLTHVSTVTTNSSVSGVIEDFRRISKETTIKSWSGAVGRAFGSGNPVWSSNRDVIVDTGRAEAFQRANIQTVLAFPINSSDRDIFTPVCVLACYSFLRIDSVPYILRFVQQALRLLWDGLDHVVPHSSVGQDLWKEVAPADLGEMAADVEMQKAFLTKKRSFGTLTAITDTTAGATPPPVQKSQDVPTTRSSFKSIRLEDEPGYFVDPAELAAAETSSSNNNDDDGSKNNNSAMENNNIDWLKMQHHVQEAVKSIGEAIPWSNRNSIIASNDEGQRIKRVCIVQSNIQQTPSSNSYNIMEQQIPQVKKQVNGLAINNNLPTRVTPPVQPSGVLSPTKNNINNNNENPATSNVQQQQQQPPPPLKQFLPSLGPISSHGGLINLPGATATPLFAPRKVLSPASLTIPAPLHHLNNMNTNPNNMTMMHVNYQENNTKKNSDTNNNSNNNNFFPHSILPPPNAHGAREKLDVALKNIEEFNALARMGVGVGIGALSQTHKVQATQKQVQTQEPKANNNNSNNNITNVKNVLGTEAPKTMTSQFPAVPPLPQYTNHNNNNNPNNINISTPNPHQQQAASFIYPQATTPLQFCVPIQPGAQKSSETTTKPGVKLCRIQGCNDPVVSRRPYCTKHSGSRLCEYPDCKKCAQGATRFCIAHGGGRRCTFPGCDKGARDKFFCAAHGGGKRCKHQGCTKSAVGGSNLCTSHGGGKRCIVEGCTKSAQSSTKFCVKHGGGKKCITPGCNKVARGKTKHCAAHGGGVRCTLPNCNRVAIGKFQLCRMHGGGSKKSKQQAQTQAHAAAVAGGENVQINFNAFQFPPLSNYPPNSSSSTTPPPPPLPPPSHHSL